MQEPCRIFYGRDIAWLEINVYLCVKPGFNVKEVSEKVQSNVKDKIQTMTGNAVTKVNVCIEDIDYVSNNQNLLSNINNFVPVYNSFTTIETEFDIDVAKTSISKLVEFKMKVCNIQQNSSEAWLQASSVQKSRCEELKLEDFRNSYAVLGIDLSQTTDLTSASLVIQKDGINYIISHFWMPAEKIDFMFMALLCYCYILMVLTV